MSETDANKARQALQLLYNGMTLDDVAELDSAERRHLFLMLDHWKEVLANNFPGTK